MDLLILAVPVAVLVSFYSIITGTSLNFLKLHPGESPAEVRQAFGSLFIYSFQGIFITGSWLYFALSESSRHQATPGKKIFGLHLADGNGRRLTFVRATARFFSGRFLAHLPYIGLVYFLVDCLCAALPPDKQAIHDHFSKCFVLRQIS